MLTRRRPLGTFGLGARAPEPPAEPEPERAPRPCTPVYPRDPFRNWAPVAAEKGPGDRLLALFRDRRFHRASEMAALMSPLEIGTALAAIVAKGYAFDRHGDSLRLRARDSGEKRQLLLALLDGLDLEAPRVDPEPVESGEALDDFDPEVDAPAPEESAARLPSGGGLVLSDPPAALTLPEEGAATRTAAILAKKGSGKTYLAGVLVEEMLDMANRVPVVVFDPMGVWWGLLSNADGTPGSREILLLGGPRGHLPVTAKSGARVADVVASAKPCAVVVDLSGLAPAEQHELVADFAERLWSLEKFCVHLVFDEADEFAPQRMGSAMQRRTLPAVERMVMRGRSRGIGVTLISLRPAVLSKNVLSQVDSMWILCLVGPNDTNAVGNWLANRVSEQQRVECLSQVPVLPRGTAYFLAGGEHPMFRRFRVRRKRTFDSSDTPTSRGARASTLSRPPSELLEQARKILSEVVGRSEKS